ncbi:hypothetical protein ACHHV8_33310 [Paenibacillus sp. TAB 01]|uniref:hypothetical protein n=1 Tax=Paenibacillus sp. TAB 01 TaxID=3368988 RepID=UPI003751BC87
MSYNYTSDFERQVNQLVLRGILDRSVRMNEIRKLIESHTGSMNHKPDTTQLERLADYILKEELTDPNPYKMSHTPYPILSPWQQELRYRREVTLKVAEEIGADGQRYAAPKRRHRSTKELLLLDEQARIRNAERAAQYQKDTAPGPISVYHLRPDEISPPSRDSKYIKKS